MGDIAAYNARADTTARLLTAVAAFVSLLQAARSGSLSGEAGIGDFRTVTAETDSVFGSTVHSALAFLGRVLTRIAADATQVRLDVQPLPY
jgi:uncharacterized membrane protein